MEKDYLCLVTQFTQFWVIEAKCCVLFYSERLSLRGNPVCPILANRKKMMCVVSFGKIVFAQ
jgi:hypothetical protein